MEQITLIKKEEFSWPPIAIGSYILSTIFIIIGFYKMFAYNNGESWEDPVNAYVGGDAYNYIINANYATGFFVLALMFVILGSTFLILKAITAPSNQRTTIQADNTRSSQEVELPPL